VLFILSNSLVVHSREVEGYFDEGDTIQYGIEIQTERLIAKIPIKIQGFDWPSELRCN
jgi:hypothetical protein